MTIEIKKLNSKEFINYNYNVYKNQNTPKYIDDIINLSDEFLINLYDSIENSLKKDFSFSKLDELKEFSYYSFCYSYKCYLLFVERFYQVHLDSMYYHSRMAVENAFRAFAVAQGFINIRSLKNNDLTAKIFEKIKKFCNENREYSDYINLVNLTEKFLSKSSTEGAHPNYKVIQKHALTEVADKKKSLLFLYNDELVDKNKRIDNFKECLFSIIQSMDLYVEIFFDDEDIYNNYIEKLKVLLNKIKSCPI